MPLSQMLLWVFLIFSFNPWLRFIGVVLLLMLSNCWCICWFDSCCYSSAFYFRWFEHSLYVTVITVHVAHGQLLVDKLAELQALRAELASFKWSHPPHPFDDESWLPFGNSSQKGGVHMDGDRGRFFCFFFCELRSFRLYLGASHCTYFLAHDVFILMSLFFMSCIW